MPLTTVFIVPAILFVLTLCYNRYHTSSGSRSSERYHNDEEQRVPLEPYWIPWIGHTISLLHDPERLLRRARYINDGAF